MLLPPCDYCHFRRHAIDAIFAACYDYFIDITLLLMDAD